MSQQTSSQEASCEETTQSAACPENEELLVMITLRVPRALREEIKRRVKARRGVLGLSGESMNRYCHEAVVRRLAAE